ncbi:restriction endonuclease subunit S [Campylobacter sp. MIT 21-1685]|uniref:restriction endonuclease subunit S n=1 Tax=unclassified Campylobacter TaxID=2593542 RepID=UPI00224AE720|nr:MULTISPECIES: restriction endonuclease subunit S [unclassified Campylobacter]MCX2682879.1 restriction endonuclease subunit S [Campylobacter sp. MIT 21-1684]MCX2751173.1 restriction endonuclease subunit S [Campylobacter sp. MIT 21-1682]MCX2807360.1 restriction endonuclease subunit S [Campylobacter sp. MIT 21-1685]
MSKVQIVWFRDLELWDFRSNNFTSDVFSNSNFPLVRIGNFLFRNKTSINIQDNKEYKRVTIKTKGQGVFLRDILQGSNIGTKNQFLIKKGQFLISKIDARNGAFGVVSDDVDNAVITGNFWTYDIDITQVNAHFLTLLTTMGSFIEFCESCSGGTTGRHYLDENKFLNANIPLPPLEIQQEIVNKIENIKNQIKALQEEEKRLKNEIEAYIYIVLGLEKKEQTQTQKVFVVNFKDLERWDITYNQANQHTKGQILFESIENITIYMQRGKTPIYSNVKKYPVIAQKCVQWSGLEIQKSLFINPDSLASYAKERFLQDDDILLNSTGIGTLGRVVLYKNKDNPYNIAVADGHITVIRFDTQRILPQYFYHYFSSELIQDKIEEYATGSTKQKELSLSLIKQIKIPLPPLEIQQEIINFVESKRDRIKANQKTIQSLRDSMSSELENLLIV